MNVTLVQNGHRYVSTTHVAIFSVVSGRMQIYLEFVRIIPQLQSYSFG